MPRPVNTAAVSSGRAPNAAVAAGGMRMPNMPQPPPPPPLPPTPPRGFMQQRGGAPPRPRAPIMPGGSQYRYTALSPAATATSHNSNSGEMLPAPSRVATAPANSNVSHSESRPIETIGRSSGGNISSASDNSFQPFALRGRGGFSRSVRPPPAFEVPDGGGNRNRPMGRGSIGHMGPAKMRGSFRGGGGGGGGGRFGHPPPTQQYSH